MTAASGVCQIVGDRTPWANFVWGLGIGLCVTVAAAAMVIAYVRYSRREWTP